MLNNLNFKKAIYSFSLQAFRSFCARAIFDFLQSLASDEKKSLPVLVLN